MSWKTGLGGSVLVAAVFAAALGAVPAKAVSLWEKRTHAGPYNYGDARARQVGDIVTIVVSETMSTKRESELKTAKKETILHRFTSLFYPKSGFGKHKGDLPMIDRDVNNSFDGSGSVDNTDSFSGTITALVIEVMPNGNLLVEGNRKIHVSNEEQEVSVSGVVRPQDIDTNNQVLSSLMADVQINYKNKGAIHDNQKRSVITRLWDKVNLF